ncbi:ribose transport system substrate-binding protein [Skermanella aerolata]|uniref:substrate-binding domain-containing protein n=1 Tax=Skermanella aerolata TaxID=393310 RepID=UPI003D1F3C07
MQSAQQWVIGFSQVTTLESWRVQFNIDIKKEVLQWTNIKLLIKDAGDKTEQQIKDVEYFINMRVDALLICPKEPPGVTSAVIKAFDARIPVFVLDRNVSTRCYTKFITGDNHKIGIEAGRHAIALLDDAPKRQIRNFFNTRPRFVLEIWGGPGTQAARDRNKGFNESLDKEKRNINIEVLPGRNSADWKQDVAYSIMIKAMQKYKEIDLVFAHNDAMAYGAYLAAKEKSRESEIKFIGVDGLVTEGADYVCDGCLHATFEYPTLGADGLKEAINFLMERKSYSPNAKEIIIATRYTGVPITKKNVAEYRDWKGRLC